MSKHQDTFDAMLGPPTVRPGILDEEDLDLPRPDADEPTLREAVEAWVRVTPPGIVAMPTYVSDLVLKNLSLAEQSIFQRLFRLAGGFARSTPRVRVGEIGKACGLRGPLVTATIRSLARKGLLVGRRRNPITGSSRYTLSLPDTIEAPLRVCCVCHLIIESAEDGWLPVPISLRPDGSYQYLPAHAECMEGATL